MHPKGLLGVRGGGSNGAMQRITALIEELAPAAQGLICRKALRSRGASAAQVDTARNNGLLLPTRWPGVYRCAGCPRSTLQDLHGAVLVNGRLSVVSHRSALLLHGLDLPTEHHVTELSVLRNGSSRTDGVVVHRPWRLEDRFVRRHPSGLLFTRTDRSIIDSGAVLPPALLDDVIEQALIQRRTSVSWLRHLAEQLVAPHRDGPPAVLDALDNRVLGDVAPGSPIEVEVANLCRDLDRPMPVGQYLVEIDGVTYYLDLAWPELMLAVEVDGRGAHLGFHFEHDRARRNDLELLGWSVINLAYDHIRKNPGYVRRTIERHIDRRLADLRALHASTDRPIRTLGA